VSLEITNSYSFHHPEAAWSADPLEFHGGFSKLQPASNATFASSITRDGRARWSQVCMNKELGELGDGNAAKIKLNVAFANDADWSFLQQVYGWAATQWQAWARGELIIRSDKPQTVLLYVENVLEYIVDGKRYFGGDFFGYRRAPAVLELAPGSHTFEVRLVRDVRAMGGIGPPSIEVTLEATIVKEPGVHFSHTLLSDVVDGKFASPYGSITVTNTKREWVTVDVVSAQVSIYCFNACSNR
jgi:hypothetical protein